MKISSVELRTENSGCLEPVLGQSTDDDADDADDDDDDKVSIESS